MDASAALNLLRDTAHPDRAGEKAASRLLDAHAMFAADMAKVHEALTQAVNDGLHPATASAAHLLSAGGKRIRPLSLLLSCACFGPVNDVARELAVVSELVHLATLLHDDVVDDGDERRGRATSRRIWGNAVSVLAGDLLLTHALERTNAVAHGPILNNLFRTLRRLVDGEVIQLRGRSKLDVSEETYFRIVDDKTASLFAWAMQSGARVGGAGEAEIARAGDFGKHLGLAFQLVDDVLDYSGDAAVTGKSLYSDLREGKLTLPLILAAKESPAILGDIEKGREGDEAACGRVLAAVTKSSACDDVRRRAKAETTSALNALSLAPESRAKELLAAVAVELTARLS